MSQVNNSLDVLAIIGGCCALLMVIGSFVLFYKGILTFKEASPDEAIKVEFQKALSVQTRYPAIALFVVGVIFLGVSLWFEKSSNRVVVVQGEIQSEDNAPVTVEYSRRLFVDPDLMPHGKIKQRLEFIPDVNEVTVHIVTPGYEPGQRTEKAQRDAEHGDTLYFGTVKIGKKVVDKPQTGPVATPGEGLAPLSN